MATLATPIQFARQITGTNSASLTDSKAIAFATDALYESRKAFANFGVDAGQIQETYFTPTAGVGTYNYPTNPPFLLLKALEVCFANLSQTNYVPAKKVDVSNTPQGYSFDYLRANQAIQQPLFNDHGSWFEIFPTPQSNMNLTQAIRFFYFIQPSPYATTGDGIAYPESIDPNVIGYGIAEAYLRSIFKFDEADKMHGKMLDKVAAVVPMLGTAGQMPTSPAGISWSGAEF